MSDTTFYMELGVKTALTLAERNPILKKAVSRAGEILIADDCPPDALGYLDIETKNIVVCRQVVHQVAEKYLTSNKSPLSLKDAVYLLTTKVVLHELGHIALDSERFEKKVLGALVAKSGCSPDELKTTALMVANLAHDVLVNGLALGVLMQWATAKFNLELVAQIRELVKGAYNFAIVDVDSFLNAVGKMLGQFIDDWDAFEKEVRSYKVKFKPVGVSDPRWLYWLDIAGILVKHLHVPCKPKQQSMPKTGSRSGSSGKRRGSGGAGAHSNASSGSGNQQIRAGDLASGIKPEKVIARLSPQLSPEDKEIAEGMLESVAKKLKPKSVTASNLRDLYKKMMRRAGELKQQQRTAGRERGIKLSREEVLKILQEAMLIHSDEGIDIDEILSDALASISQQTEYTYSEPTEEDIALRRWARTSPSTLAGRVRRIKLPAEYSVIPSTFVLIADVSGSMAEDLPIVFKSLAKLLTQFKPDRALVVLFSDRYKVYEIGQEDMTDEASLYSLFEEMMENMDMLGGTAPAGAFNYVLDLLKSGELEPENTVVVTVTDGYWANGYDEYKKLCLESENNYLLLTGVPVDQSGELAGGMLDKFASYPNLNLYVAYRADDRTLKFIKVVK